jgi:hypothetical protein
MNITSDMDRQMDHPVIVDILRELVSFKRKFKMIGQFLKTFFKHDKKHLKNMPRTGKLQTEI